MLCTLVDRGVPRCGAGSSTGATLRRSQIRSATSVYSRACTRSPVGWRRNPIYARAPRTAAGPQGRVEECPPRATEVCVQHGQPNVAVRAVIILEACVAAPSERWCRRNAERNQLQALPDLASCPRLLYVCVPPPPSAVGHVPLWSGGFALVCGRLVGHNRLKDLPESGLPPTLQRLC
jgi:hypothetical protein